MVDKRRTGRRPGHQPTREKILAGARGSFAQRGYDATSVREIAATEGPREQLAERLLTTALTVWDSLPDSPPVRCCAVRRRIGAELLREFLLKRALEPLCGAIEPDPVLAKWRMNLVASQLMGLAMMRYVLAMEPLASAPHQRIVDMIGPNLQRFLTGELHAT